MSLLNRSRSLFTRFQPKLFTPTTFTPNRTFAVQTMSSDKELRDIIAKNQNKLVVIDWSAAWCGPCRQIAPIYKQLSDQYTNVVFLKCDVDELSSSASEAGVQSVPTFHFIKNDQLLDEFAGADQNKLQQTIEKHSQ